MADDPEDLLRQAEARYHLKIFENISRDALASMPLAVRLEVVGRAVMERTDLEGFIVGRKLLAQSRQLKAV